MTPTASSRMAFRPAFTNDENLSFSVLLSSVRSIVSGQSGVQHLVLKKDGLHIEQMRRGVELIIWD